MIWLLLGSALGLVVAGLLCALAVWIGRRR
jgi:hypothetical protein